MSRHHGFHDAKRFVGDVEQVNSIVFADVAAEDGNALLFRGARLVERVYSVKNRFRGVKVKTTLLRQPGIVNVRRERLCLNNFSNDQPVANDRTVGNGPRPCGEHNHLDNNRRDSDNEADTPP